VTIVAFLTIAAGVGLMARQQWSFVLVYAITVLTYYIRLSFVPFLGFALNFVVSFQTSGWIVMVANCLFAAMVAWVHTTLRSDLLWHPLSAPSPSQVKTNRKVTLLQEEVNAHERPSADSPVTLALKAGDVMYLRDVVKTADEDWVQVHDSTGTEGFISGDRRIQVVTMRRFMVERAAFIAMASLLGGLLSGIVAPESAIPVLGVIGMTAFLMTGVYVAAKTFTGKGGFFEDLPADTTVPTFDWQKFLLDPLYFIGLAIVMFLLVGVAMLFRWAMKGADK
jgi:hypothetical protein